MKLSFGSFLAVTNALEKALITVISSEYRSFGIDLDQGLIEREVGILEVFQEGLFQRPGIIRYLVLLDLDPRQAAALAGPEDGRQGPQRHGNVVGRGGLVGRRGGRGGRGLRGKQVHHELPLDRRRPVGEDEERQELERHVQHRRDRHIRPFGFRSLGAPGHLGTPWFGSGEWLGVASGEWRVASRERQGIRRRPLLVFHRPVFPADNR